MKRKKIIIMIIIGISLYYLYLYIDNGFNNVDFSVTINMPDSVYMEVYWDGKKIDERFYRFFPFGYKLNVLPGKHTIKIKGEDFEEEHSFFIFPLKYINLEYYGPESSLFKEKNRLFFIRQRSFTPLMYD